MKKTRKKRGPRPKVIRADGVSWQDAMKHALKKPKPAEGWPEDKTPPDPDAEKASG